MKLQLKVETCVGVHRGVVAAAIGRDRLQPADRELRPARESERRRRPGATRFATTTRPTRGLPSKAQCET